MTTSNQYDDAGAQDVTLSTFDKLVGTILAISYPLLALSTGVRALYQLFLKEDVSSYVGPTLSLVAAALYLIATIGFAVRKPWAWKLSVAALGVETLLTLAVGTLSLIYPDVIGNTVWRAYGADYGWFPLIQPLIGLVWLLRSHTMRVYGVKW